MPTNRAYCRPDRTSLAQKLRAWRWLVVARSVLRARSMRALLFAVFTLRGAVQSAVARVASVVLVGLVLLARPAAAAECADNGACPDYFTCRDGLCIEDRIDCSSMCPPHLSCQPTTTTPSNGMGEPAPSGFYCGWVHRECATSADCQTGFECVLCGPDEPNYCNDVCLPARMPCDTHADCPEFSHCFDFSADELPSHWAAGAGRACKPLLGSQTYSPRTLAGGTLVDGTGTGMEPGTGTGMEPGTGIGMEPGTGTDAGNSAAMDGVATREVEGCGCRATRSGAVDGWLALGLAALVAARRRRF